jgi:hypothetical protein
MVGPAADTPRATGPRTLSRGRLDIHSGWLYILHHAEILPHNMYIEFSPGCFPIVRDGAEYQVQSCHVWDGSTGRLQFYSAGIYLILASMLQNHSQYIDSFAIFELQVTTQKLWVALFWGLFCWWLDVNLHEFFFLYALTACYTVGSCKLHGAFSLHWRHA